MNKVLRKVARQLRYRPLPELIDTKVTIESLASVESTVRAAVARVFPLVRFIESQKSNIIGTLAKYSILDLTWPVHGIEWQSGDVPGTAILKEFGFASHPAEHSEEQPLLITQDFDPNCLLQFLAEEVDLNQAVFRLFLNVTRRDLREHHRGLTKSGKWVFDLETILKILNNFFPHEMVISDACLTNAPSIWFLTHFYM